MENNLEDILVDNIEEKPSSSSKVKIIVIGIASVVLIAVLATLVYVLFKNEPPRNPEFDNAELEKIAPTQPVGVEDDLDKLIAQIKNKEQITQDSVPTHQETQIREKDIMPVDESAQKNTMPELEKKDALPEKKQTSQIQNEKQNIPVKVTEEKIQPKVKKQESKKKEEKAQSNPTPSASKAFETIKTSVIPKGFYLQVGVFSNEPQKQFITKIKKYSYKTDTIQKNGKILTRYLVGPYQSKDESKEMIFPLMQSIGIKPVIIEIK